MIVEMSEDRGRIGGDINRGNFSVSVCLLCRSTTPLESWWSAAVPLFLPAAVHGAFRDAQQQPPGFIGIAEGDGDGVGEGDDEG